MSSKPTFGTPEQIRIVPRVALKKDLVSHPLLLDKFTAQRDQVMEQGNLIIGTLDKERQVVSFRNAFDIPRKRLMQQVSKSFLSMEIPFKIFTVHVSTGMASSGVKTLFLYYFKVARMRNNFLQSDYVALDQDSAHSLPISQMGNYQEYLKKQTPQLREIESAPVRQHMFGNPFKIDKRMMVSHDVFLFTRFETKRFSFCAQVDEADIDLVGSPGNNKASKRTNSDPLANTRASKRKPGPLPRDLIVRRPSLSDASFPSSPVPMSPSPVPWYVYKKIVISV